MQFQKTPLMRAGTEGSSCQSGYKSFNTRPPHRNIRYHFIPYGYSTHHSRKTENTPCKSQKSQKSLYTACHTETTTPGSEMMAIPNTAPKIHIPEHPQKHLQFTIGGNEDAFYTVLKAPRSTRGQCREDIALEGPAEVALDHVHVQNQKTALEQLARQQLRRNRMPNYVARFKKNQIILIQEEEMRCFCEDVAGTPHISELQTEDDVVAVPRIEVFGLGGEIKNFQSY